jgi:hypothetical protein
MMGTRKKAKKSLQPLSAQKKKNWAHGECVRNLLITLHETFISKIVC